MALHLRMWRRGRANAACQPMPMRVQPPGGTTPDLAKVTCPACRREGELVGADGSNLSMEAPA